MITKKTLIKLLIILLIFFIGFTLRVESTSMPGVPDDEKAFYEDQNGLPYMYELDSYYNYRLTENYLDHGYLGDTIINCEEWDLHSYYPPGVPMDYPPLIVYVTAFIYKLVNLFANIPLIVVCFWLPAVIGPLSGVIAYLFARRFTNEYGAIAAGIFAVTAPILTSVTIPGFFRTSMFNVLFPLLVVWLFIEAVNNKDNLQKGILISAIAAFFMFTFSMAWSGWSYTFYLIVLFNLSYIIWSKFKGKDVKNLAYVLGTFFIGTVLMIGIFTGFIHIVNLFSSLFSLVKIVGPQSPWAPWPDIYIMVSELGKPSIEEIISGVGLAFLGGIFGLLWILRILINNDLKKRFLNRMNWFFYMFLVIWTLLGFFSLLKGERFILMLVPPMVISAGIMIGICVEYLNILKNNQRFKIFRKRKNITKFISILILIWITVLSIISCYNSYSTLPHTINDNLWDASQWINNNTSNDTVIISEWSYGHFFTGIADRPVVFDGRLGYIETLPLRSYDSAYIFGDKSPSVSREYWIYRAFETDNESLSLGIFRMIATSGDLGYLTLDNYTGNTTKTAEILNSILGLNKNKALDVMTNNYGLSTQEAQNVLKYTHPDDSQSFVIVTTSNMINKGYWMFYFGSWDFKKSKGSDLTYTFGNINTNDNILNSSNGILMNLNTGNVTWNGKNPYSVITSNNGKIEKHYLDKNSDFSVLINRDYNKSVVIDSSFENSLFTKLVIEGSNSTNFKLIYENGDVNVWKYN